MNKKVITCIFTSEDAAQVFIKFIEHVRENKEISPLMLGSASKVICEEMKIIEDEKQN